MTKDPHAVVITGAAGGIGGAVARLLGSAAPEAIVVAIDRARPGTGDLHEALGDHVLAVHADITTADGMEAVAGALAQLDRPVSGLVNAAGNTSVVPSLAIESADLDTIMKVHLEATLRMSQLVAPFMAQRGAGSIVNLSSVAARFGWPGRLAYACAKAAVEAMTRTLAAEWAPMGIRVNAVAPGYVNTPMSTVLQAEGAYDPEQRRAGHILGRFAEPEEIASMICFLLGDGASFVTGQIIAVDGGFTVTKDAHAGGAQA